jgi:TonB family protein
MKKFAFLFLLSAVLMVSSLHAEERAMIQSLSSSMDSKQALSNPFVFTMTEQGQLVVKPGTVFTTGGDYTGMTLPYLLSSPKPITYPRWAIEQGWEGDFVIALEILENGNVGRTKVMKSTGHKMLDETATKAIHGWKFHPAMKNGKAIVTCSEIPVRFQLEKE